MDWGIVIPIVVVLAAGLGWMWWLDHKRKVRSTIDGDARSSQAKTQGFTQQYTNTRTPGEQPPGSLM